MVIWNQWVRTPAGHILLPLLPPTESLSIYVGKELWHQDKQIKLGSFTSRPLDVQSRTRAVHGQGSEYHSKLYNSKQLVVSCTIKQTFWYE